MRRPRSSQDGDTFLRVKKSYDLKLARRWLTTTKLFSVKVMWSSSSQGVVPQMFGTSAEHLEDQRLGIIGGGTFMQAGLPSSGHAATPGGSISKGKRCSS